MAQQRLVAIVEARMGSSRLPGKVMHLLGGRPALQVMGERIRHAHSVADVIVATSDGPLDDILAAACNDWGMKVFRGSELDVLGRLNGAADRFGGEYIIKVTGDCPVIDPDLIDEVVGEALKFEADLTSNGAVRTYPDGMDCAVIKTSALNASAAQAVDPKEREHSTLFLRRRTHEFVVKNVLAPTELTWPDLRLTLDTPEDYRLLRKLFEDFGGDPPLACMELIKWAELNPFVPARVREAPSTETS